MIFSAHWDHLLEDDADFEREDEDIAFDIPEEFDRYVDRKK